MVRVINSILTQTKNIYKSPSIQLTKTELPFLLLPFYMYRFRFAEVQKQPKYFQLYSFVAFKGGLGHGGQDPGPAMLRH